MPLDAVAAAHGGLDDFHITAPAANTTRTKIHTERRPSAASNGASA